MPWGSMYDVFLYTPRDHDDSDNNQYSSWNRTRRLHAPTYLARVDTSASRTATALRSGSGKPSIFTPSSCFPTHRYLLRDQSYLETGC